MPSLLEQVLALQGPDDGTPGPFAYRGPPVGQSEDLQRILAIPRRQLDPNDPRAAVAWTKHLRRARPEGCDCDQRWGVLGPEGKPIPGSGCITDFMPIQGWALEEAMDLGGVVVMAGVGWGKTGITLAMPMAIPGIKVAMLLIPTATKRQLFEKDYEQWRAHFQVPNLVDGPGPFIADGRPVLKVITYAELSLPKNSDILTRNGVPDIIIADESHNLKNAKGPRARRVMRAREAGCKRFAMLSASATDKSIKEMAHTMHWVLGDNTPAPTHPPTLDEWSAALDPGMTRPPIGMLASLCKPGESLEQGFARRLSDTKGVIVTTDASVQASLNISAADAPAMPDHLLGLIQGTREGRRPDGEISMEAMTSSRWGRQLAAGFYSYRHFPRGEPDALIFDWLEKRKNYHKEGREKLKYSREFLDQPLLLWNAASRWHEGYAHDGKTYPPHTKNGPMPVWHSETWPAWKEIRYQVEHETRYRWESDYLVDHCAKWALSHKGIVWTEHKDFGARLAEKTGLKFYDGGKLNPERDEKGDRSIIASVQANSTGLNLQRLWWQNLYPTPMSTNKAWEQSLGRTHRKHQRNDEVTAEVYLHTAEMRRAWDTAYSRARYVQTTTKNPQKLCLAALDLRHAVKDDLRQPTESVTKWWEQDD